MRKSIVLSISIFVFIVLLYSCLQSNNKISQKEFEKAKTNYINYCAGCHGYDLEEFVGRDWIYGKNPEDLFNIIKSGKGDIGMPSFNAAFADDEIEQLTTYILNKGKIQVSSEVVKAKDSKIISSEKQKYWIDTIVKGLDVPWGMTWLPNGDMLIAEREGILYRFSDGKLYEIKSVPKVYAKNQGGLMDIELHPNYSKNEWIYITYSYVSGTLKNGTSTMLIRCKLKNDELVDIEEIMKAIPADKKYYHFGSRIEFDKEGYLYVSVGDRGRRPNAQLLTNHSGSLHRFNDDGSIPSDNPFVHIPEAIKSIFTYGHRNIQGVALNPQTGDLWTHEHGPKGGDELNIEHAGYNYGWPEITYGINYNGTIITEDTAKEGMEQPIIYWIPSIAPCGMDFVEGDLYESWKGDLLVGSLRFKYVVRCEIENNKVTHQELLFKDIGRVRNVKQSPNGYIYVAVETPGKILRIMPVDE